MKYGLPRIGPEMTDDEMAAAVECERDDEFLDFARLVQRGAEAIHEKRRLQSRNAELQERVAQLQKMLDDGDAARASILRDVVGGLSSGRLKVDPAAPMPAHMAGKAS